MVWLFCKDCGNYKPYDKDGCMSCREKKEREAALADSEHLEGAIESPQLSTTEGGGS